LSRAALENFATGPHLQRASLHTEVLSGYDDSFGGAGAIVETVKAEVCNDIDSHVNGDLDVVAGTVAPSAQRLDDSIDYIVDMLRK
jgi:hypothetical protein